MNDEITDKVRELRRMTLLPPKIKLDFSPQRQVKLYRKIIQFISKVQIELFKVHEILVYQKFPILYFQI